jgi:hypothetical protein
MGIVMVYRKGTLRNKEVYRKENSRLFTNVGEARKFVKGKGDWEIMDRAGKKVRKLRAVKRRQTNAFGFPVVRKW